MPMTYKSSGFQTLHRNCGQLCAARPFRWPGSPMESGTESDCAGMEPEFFSFLVKDLRPRRRAMKKPLDGH